MNRNDHKERVWFQVHTENEQDIVHWHEDLKIAFVLFGQVDMTIRDKTYTLYAGDLLVLNPFELHVVTTREGHLLALHLSPTFLQSLGHMVPRFAFYSRQAPSIAVQQLRQWLAHSVSALLAQDETLAEGYVHMMLSLLNRDFAQPDTAQDQGGDSTALQYVQRAVQTFQAHYREDWTVQRLAEAQHLSVGYLSRIFQAHMGTSVMKYLRMLRLRRAMQEVLHSSKSITEIASENGFASTTAFIQNFRTEYGQTPKQMRRQEGGQVKPIPHVGSPIGLERLLQYCQEPAESQPPAATEYQVQEVVCDCQKRSRAGNCPLMMSIGWAREGILAPVQEQIQQAQREIGFTYLRMHGIFDDRMQIFQGTSEQYSFNFNYFDLLYDFVLAQGLLPYLEFSYMPSALAVRSETYYSHRCSICPPSDWVVWNELVSETILHCVNRYGRASVRKWKFTTISHCYVSYGCMTEQEWLRLYRETYQTVKAVDKRLSFGGPGNDMDYLGRDDGALLRWFLSESAYYHCLPDFLSVQCFHVDSVSLQGADVFATVTDKQTLPIPCSPDPDYLEHCLDHTESYLQRLGLDKLPIVLEAWNSSLWQNDPCHDMRFKAAFIVKNLLENRHRLAGINYWVLSDIMEETTHQMEVFHGGYGMFTTNSIPKSAYHAFRLIARMKGGCIGRGDGWYATRDQDTVAVLLYHYGHYVDTYQALRTKGQYAFQDSGPRQFNLLLTGLKEGVYTFSMYRIDSTHGSAYDTWLQMGSPEPMNTEQVDYIQRLSIPSYTTCQEYVPRQYHYTTTLGSNEVELILCKPSAI